MAATPTRNFRLSEETMAQLRGIARREGLGNPTAAIRWLAARASRGEAPAAAPERPRSAPIEEEE